MKSLRFIAFSCPHCPLQDDRAIGALLSVIAREKPHVVVHLGDGHEADAASRWPSEYGWTLDEEFAAHDDLLRAVRKSAPRARRVFLPGNHEDNMLSWNRIDRRVRGLCDYRQSDELRHYWEQPAEYIYDKRKGVFRLGQVVFAHGYEHGISGDEAQAFLLGDPGGLVVLGHTHRPTELTQARRTATIPLPYWHINAGCLRNLKPPYMRRKRSHLWGHACVVGHANPSARGKLDRQWDARLVRL